MNHKQQAKELIEKFAPHTMYEDDFVGEEQVKEEFESAIQCALICVDEIISSHKFESIYGKEISKEGKDYQKVKKEIENIKTIK